MHIRLGYSHKQDPHPPIHTHKIPTPPYTPQKPPPPHTHTSRPHLACNSDSTGPCHQHNGPFWGLGIQLHAEQTAPTQLDSAKVHTQRDMCAGRLPSVGNTSMSLPSLYSLPPTLQPTSPSSLMTHPSLSPFLLPSPPPSLPLSSPSPSPSPSLPPHLLHFGTSADQDVPRTRLWSRPVPQLREVGREGHLVHLANVAQLMLPGLHPPPTNWAWRMGHHDEAWLRHQLGLRVLRQ